MDTSMPQWQAMKYSRRRRNHLPPVADGPLLLGHLAMVVIRVSDSNPPRLTDPPRIRL
jgi:hypothetical protein